MGGAGDPQGVHGVDDIMGRQILFDPVVNVQLGVAYLEYLRDWFGDLETW